jgi:hypothetical protein
VTGMPQRSPDRVAIEAEIDRVRSLGLHALRSQWRTTFRSPPLAFTRDLMARFLCWHIQEQALGGLDARTAKLLDGLLAASDQHRSGALSSARCLCANTRASATRSQSFRMATSGTRRPPPAYPPSHAPSPARPGTAPVSLGCAPPPLVGQASSLSKRTAIPKIPDEMRER